MNTSFLTWRAKTVVHEKFVENGKRNPKPANFIAFQLSFVWKYLYSLRSKLLANARFPAKECYFHWKPSTKMLKLNIFLWNRTSFLAWFKLIFLREASARLQNYFLLGNLLKWITFFRWTYLHSFSNKARWENDKPIHIFSPLIQSRGKLCSFKTILSLVWIRDVHWKEHTQTS